ncbi:SDR family NAD(P)-dependent oxidoreductase [Nonomuraea thailandensis]
MGQLDGKIALVTGATSGIGLASARTLAAEGAYVFLTGRRKEKLDEVVAGIGADRATGIQADVTDLEDLDRVMAAVGGPAGASTSCSPTRASPRSPRWARSPGSTTHTFNTNVGGIVFTLQKALPLLKDGSSVILCGSNVAIKASPAMSVYAATKAAIRSLGRTFAAELTGRGIRVNTIAPGPTETPGLLGVTGDGEEQRAAMIATVPMNRLARPEETAGVVAFLASDRSSFMTGTEVHVDGGASQF